MNRRQLLALLLAPASVVVAAGGSDGKRAPREARWVLDGRFLGGAAGHLPGPAGATPVHAVGRGGLDLPRLWQASLLPALRAGQPVRGIVSHADFVVLSGLARAAGLRVEASGTCHCGAAQLRQWVISPPGRTARS